MFTQNQKFQIYFILHDSYAKSIAEFEYEILKILNIVFFALFKISIEFEIPQPISNGV